MGAKKAGDDMDIENKLDRDAPDHLGGRPGDKDGGSSLTRRLAAELSTNHVDIPLLACCLCSGLTDSTLYNGEQPIPAPRHRQADTKLTNFSNQRTAHSSPCKPVNQTTTKTHTTLQQPDTSTAGNTIFVALGASHQNTKPYGWARSLCSIGCFILGSLSFSRLSATLGPKRRLTLTLSFLLQSILIIVAAAIVQGGAINGTIPQPPTTATTAVRWNELAPIALLSFQSAAQIVSSRALGLAEVPTVVVTSLLCDLMSDTQLLAPPTANVKRNRRVAAFVLTLVGAIAGGWISKATRGVEYALWVVAGIKLVITAGWLVWREKA